MFVYFLINLFSEQIYDLACYDSETQSLWLKMKDRIESLLNVTVKWNLYHFSKKINNNSADLFILHFVFYILFNFSN